MECVAFEFVLDFEFEAPSSAKSLDVIYFADDSQFFADLSMVTTAKYLWSASR